MTVLTGTINLQEVELSLRKELESVTNAIKELVNAKPFGQQTSDDVREYLRLREEQESLTLQLL